MRVIAQNLKLDGPVFKKIRTFKKYPNYDVRFISFEPKVIFSIHNKEVYLMTDPARLRGPPYLVSNQPSFLELSQKYFDSTWRGAIKFDDYIENQMRTNIGVQFNHKDTIFGHGGSEIFSQDIKKKRILRKAQTI